MDRWDVFGEAEGLGVSVSRQNSPVLGPVHIARKGDVAQVIVSPDTVRLVAEEADRRRDS